MTNRILRAAGMLLLALAPAAVLAQQATVHVLALYSTQGETDHVDFAKQAIQFYAALAKKDHFSFEATTDWKEMNAATLRQYQVVLWLNAAPETSEARAAFQAYMEHGGAWLGFHASGYNDSSTHWPWFANFIGAVFYGNSWPPLPAELVVDDRTHPVTHRLPAAYLSPANEWYSWSPNPRAGKNIKVLLTLGPAGYPLGFKDTLVSGDIPVVWTNTKYRMIYMNMGHGDKIFTSPTQNRLFEDAILWLGNLNKDDATTAAR